MVVTGGSYGGFLTGWIVGHYHEFKAAVSQRGVYDQLNMFGSGDIPESIEWYHNGLPRPETLAELWEFSPAAHAGQVTTPTLLLHSELDYRVPISQAETFFAALRRHGNRDATMVRYPNEGHELSRSGQPLHRIDRLYRIVGWFDRFVQPQRADGGDLTGDALAAALRLIPGWQVSDGRLAREIEGGTYAIARGLAEQVSSVASAWYTPPAVRLEGTRLTIQLGRPECTLITDRDVQLARMLDRRIFAELRA
jgi:pterin-4a-carbinolamine dehydratase